METNALQEAGGSFIILESEGIIAVSYSLKKESAQNVGKSAFLRMKVMEVKIISLKI